MNYRAESAAIASRRAAAVSAAKAKARAEKIALKAARDIEVHRLSADGMGGEDIAATVGISVGSVYEILLPAERRAARNARRARYWHEYARKLRAA